MWQVRMLGRFEVLSAELAPASFRSRKVAALLAFLLLNQDKPVANATLQELLWPDSDGDRQAQSLRRAVADLRDALEGSESGREIVRTEQGKTRLAEGLFETDTDNFDALLAKLEFEDDLGMSCVEGLTLYGGPLLAPLDEDWVYAYRRQYEEKYCRGVLELTYYLSSQGKAKEASRIANAAIVLAPLREEPFIASIHAYASMGNRSMALRQYEALEKMLDDHYGQTPSEAAIGALDAPEVGPYSAIPRSDDASGGMAAESRFYVERSADTEVSQALEQEEAVILVFGPRQTGKTSLLARSSAALRRQGKQVAITDFQALSRSELDRPVTLYRSLLHSLASQLGLEYEPSWNEWVGPNSNLDAQVYALLKRTEGPVCWAMDEVDRLFGLEYSDDFFGLVRSWHNRRALDPDGPWRRLTLMISYATEAHLFITDLNQSPFNVGRRVSLKDFSAAQVWELGMRYGSIVGAHGDAVYDLTQGHPFLTRRAFAFLQGGKPILELQQLALAEEGPFADHFKHVRVAASKDPGTKAEIVRLLTGEPFQDANTLARLTAAGILASDPEGRTRFRVHLYESVLRGLAA